MESASTASSPAPNVLLSSHVLLVKLASTSSTIDVPAAVPLDPLLLMESVDAPQELSKTEHVLPNALPVSPTSTEYVPPVLETVLNAQEPPPPALHALLDLS